MADLRAQFIEGLAAALVDHPDEPIGEVATRYAFATGLRKATWMAWDEMEQVRVLDQAHRRAQQKITTATASSAPQGDSMKLSERDIDTLQLLHGYGKAARPLDIGGHSGSHHSATLNKLARLGLVERIQQHYGARPSYRYRITEAGKRKLAPPPEGTPS